MDIQDLGAIGEFVSSIAIVVTLILLLLEMRQARRATQASNRHARQRIRTDVGLLAAGNAQLCELLARSMPNDVGPQFWHKFELTDAENIQLAKYMLTFVRYLEDQFFSDLPDTDRIALQNHIQSIKAFPYAMAFWEATKSTYDRRFREFVDATLEEIDPNPGFFNVPS